MTKDYTKIGEQMSKKVVANSPRVEQAILQTKPQEKKLEHSLEKATFSLKNIFSIIIAAFVVFNFTGLVLAFLVIVTVFTGFKLKPGITEAEIHQFFLFRTFKKAVHMILPKKNANKIDIWLKDSFIPELAAKNKTHN